MFDFQEELKNFKPSVDADLVAFDLKGEGGGRSADTFALYGAGCTEELVQTV